MRTRTWFNMWSMYLRGTWFVRITSLIRVIVASILLPRTMLQSYTNELFTMKTELQPMISWWIKGRKKFTVLRIRFSMGSQPSCVLLWNPWIWTSLIWSFWIGRQALDRLFLRKSQAAHLAVVVHAEHYSENATNWGLYPLEQLLWLSVYQCR